MTKILIVDDNRSIRRILSEILETRYYTVRSVGSGRACLEVITQENFDLILLDIKMHGMDGLEVLQELNQMNLTIPVIMMSAHGRDGTAKEVIMKGAFNYIQKPFDSHQLLEMIADALKNYSTKRSVSGDGNDTTKTKTVNTNGRQPAAINMIGSSAKFLKMKEAIERVAPTDIRVLIEGPNGAGKELVARRIHALSPRRKRRFVEVNCAAIPGELIESILFGHTKGSFTGANKETTGLFQQAEGGTIFLDEIGDMPFGVQSKILRVLQENKITKVGGSREIDINVRVIAATNQNLAEMIFAKTFREDLYYRLEEWVIKVPSLNERKSDIPELVNHFVRSISKQNGRTPPTITKEAMTILEQLNYPGNIRQLKNVIRRLLVVCGASISVAEVNEFAPKVLDRQREIIDMINLVKRLGGIEAAINFIREHFKD